MRRLTEAHSYDNPFAKPELTPDGKVIVYFHARELHTVVREIVYDGAKHIKQDDLDSLSGLRKGMPMNPNANKQACQALLTSWLVRPNRPTNRLMGDFRTKTKEPAL